MALRKDLAWLDRRCLINYSARQSRFHRLIHCPLFRLFEQARLLSLNLFSLIGYY